MSDDPHCAQIALEVLGPLRVCDERRTIKIAGAKERTLLARLVASAGRLVTTDELIDCLWSDDPPRTAAKSLQTYVLRLRNLLEPNRHRSPQLLLTDGPGYRLAVSDDAIDARRFARLVDNGRRAFRAGDAAAATEKLRDSLRLWRGRAYAGFELNPVLGGESRRLEELRLVALEDRIAADLDVGRSRETVAELESLVHEHRLRERFWCLLMLALYRAGRQADALAAHARARELLVDELGVEPGEQLRTLHGQVLAQDHRLLVPASPSPPLAPPPEPKVCPWKGLAAYDVADAPWFAGRERLVAELLARIATARVVAVVGASGSGKSSLVRAGLLASLPDSTGWVRVLMRPGSHPLRELERVRGNSDGRRVVLVVDQLEELWTACANPVERKEFLDALADLVVPGNRTLVLAVRADYFAELADQPVLAGAVADATVLVGTPSEGEVRRAVQHPADRGGLELDIGLADALVADAGHGPGALPLLSTALTELWDQRDGQRLTLTAYVEAGGVHGAVARLAERAYDALDPGDQRAARILLLRLASVGDGETVTRRRVPLAELAALPDPRVRAVVEPLARARLLSLGAGHVEVVHEALFREWPRLQAWLQEDATGRATQRRLAIAAGEWHAGGREPTELWRGTRLAAGLDFAATHPDELTEVEHAFLAAGRAQQDTERIAAEHQAGVATRQNRRLRWLLGGLAVLLSVALTAGVVAVRSAARAEREALVASAHELAAASVANLAVDPERSILLALEAVAQARSLDGPVRWQAEEALHRAVITSRVVLSVPGLGGNLDWSPDGSVFVTEGPENAGVVDIRDATTGRSVRSWHGHDGDITDVAFSPDGTMLATTGDDGAARLWDPATGEGLTAIQGPRGEVSAPSFSPDGSLLAASWENDGVRVVEIDTGRTVRELGAFALQTAFSPEGDRLVIASGEPEATVADIGSGELSRLGNQSWGINEVAWSTSGAWIATAGTDLTAQIWDAETGELRFTLFGHTGFVNTVDWSSDSARLITGSADGTAKVWELTDGGPRVLLTLSAHDTRAGLRAVFSPDGRYALTGDRGIAAAKIWDVTPAGVAEWATVPGDPVGYGGVDFAPDGRLVASRGDGQVSTWDPTTGRELAPVLRHDRAGQVVAVDVAPDGGLVATTGFEEPVKVWDALTGDIAFTVPGLEDAAWSPDGSLLAATNFGAGSGVTIVDRSGEALTVLPNESDLVAGVVRFSPDGQLLVVASEPDGWRDFTAAKVHVWDWRRKEIVLTIPTWANDVAFDPVGGRIVTMHREGYAELWDLDGGARIAVLPSRSGSLGSVAFSPDGSRIATTGADGTVRLWDVEIRVQLLELHGHTEMVWDAAFSWDGSMLASASVDGTVRVWAVDLDDLIEIANRKLTRGLIDDECHQYLHLSKCR